MPHCEVLINVRMSNWDFVSENYHVILEPRLEAEEMDKEDHLGL